MQTSSWRAGARRAGLTMAARIFSTDGFGRLRGGDVIGAGAVAALAIDAFGERAGVEGLGAGLVVAGGDLRVGVVAEHALVGDCAVGENVVAIVAGAQAHSPPFSEYQPRASSMRPPRSVRCR